MSAAVRVPGVRVAIGVVLPWTFGVTVLRAVRWPNDFAEAHWLLDYRLGLIRRGLPGEVLSLVTGLFGGDPTEGIIAALSVLFLVLLVAALAVVAWRMLAIDGWSAASAIAIAAFLSSSYVVMAAHLTGYFDHIVVLLSIVAVALVLRGRVWPAFVLLAVSVLVHEHTLVLGLPAAVVACLFASDRRRERGERPLSLLPVGLPLLSFGVLAAAGARLSADVFQDTFVRHLESYPFVAGDMHLFVPEWLATGVLASAGTQAHRFVERLTSRDILIFVLPAMVALVAFALDRFVVRRRLSMLALVGAVLAPQLLHMSGWDTVRIWTFSVVTAFVCAWVVVETCRPRGRAPSPVVMVVACAAVVVNVVTAVPLYDNLSERFTLATRLWLYAPLLVACLWWAARPRRP